MTIPLVDVNRYRGQFFAILQETARSQIGVMTIGPGRDAGPEETYEADQIIYVVEGDALVPIEGAEYQAAPGACVLIPAGARHAVRNPGAAPLFFLTVYAPPAY